MGLDNPLHIAFIVVALLLIFGAKRLPEIGRSLGSGMREFKSSITGDTPTLTAAAPSTVTTPAPEAPTSQAVAGEPAQPSQAA